MKKNIFVSLLIPFFFLFPSLWGVSNNDFDKIVDFSITLEELSLSLKTGDFSRIDKTKFVILNGSISAVHPTKSDFYLLEPEDFINMPAFINTLKKASDKVSRYLIDQLPSDLQDKIKAYKGASENDGKLVKDIIVEFKRLFKSNNMYDADRFSVVKLNPTLEKYAQRENLEDGEMAFVNRLLMEAAYPGTIKQIRMELEIMYAVWIGYDEVKSYTSIIEFKGLECFKIFVRRKPEDASPEMIDSNATVLVVAKIVDVYTRENGEKGWFLEGLYIREVRQ